jgi:hypothetical protein
MLKRLLCIVLGFAATAAHAGDTFAVVGPAGLTCGTYLETSADNRRMFGWWLAGFVSGQNAAKNREQSPDLATAQAWVDNWCRSHALDQFAFAAVKLDEELDLRAKAR